MSGDLERRRVRIAGRVQGVAFRATTLEEARRLGVAGWVRNLPDGRVEAVLEAAGPALREMLDFCRRGPSWAEVNHVDVLEEAPEGCRGFEIR